MISLAPRDATMCRLSRRTRNADLSAVPDLDTYADHLREAVARNRPRAR